MEIGRPTAGDVKGSQKKLFRIVRRGKPDARAIILFIRIKGYLDGVWERGHGKTKFYFWNKHTFARKTGSGENGYSVKHLERMFPRFMAWCTAYRFERVRLHRSWRIKVTQNFGVRGDVSGAAIRWRLEGAICGMVKKAGVARVDREFLRKFCALSHLPREAVALVWAQLRPLQGFACRWRGVGAGRKFLVERISEKFEVSHPQTSRGISSFHEKRSETIGRQAAGHDPNRPLAPLAQEGISEESSAGLRPAMMDPPAPAGFSAEHPTGPGAGPRTPNRYEGPKIRQFCAPSAVQKPMQICNRFVSSRRLLAKAVWLAVDPMKKLHADFERVCWFFAHARNFAERALRDGYGAQAIVDAWRSGVRESHEDALDADRLPGGGYAHQRAPSAAVRYAWRELWRDQRTREERWAEFFALPYEPRRPVERKPSAAAGQPDLAGAAAPRAPTVASTARRIRDLRSAQEAPTALEAQFSVLAAGTPAAEFRRPTIESLLKQRGFSVASFMALSRGERDQVMRDLIAVTKKGVDTKQGFCDTTGQAGKPTTP